MAGRWTYTVGADGIVTVAFAIDLNPGAGELGEAMTRLASAAAVEATAQSARKRGEP